MTGTTLRSRARSAVRLPVRAGLLAVLAVLALVAVPGTASAATYGGSYGGYDGGYSGYDGYGGGYGGYDGYGGSYGGSYGGGYSGTVYVTPLLDCVVTARDGSYTAVLGYKNTNRSSTYTITGSYNVISPSRYDGDQPTSFKPGTYHGVFSLPVSSGTVYWDLAGTRLTISRTAASACPAGTTLPASGNGTGIAIALVAAGVLGVLLVRRARRTASAPAPAVGAAA